MYASKQDAPFFTVKLGVKVLPCVIAFRDGVTVDRVVGFEGLGGKDDFDTAVRGEGAKRGRGLSGGAGGGGGGDHSAAQRTCEKGWGRA